MQTVFLKKSKYKNDVSIFSFLGFPNDLSKEEKIDEKCGYT